MKRIFQVVVILLTLLFFVSVHSTSVVIGRSEENRLEIDSKQELRRWWNPGFDGYSTEQIKAAIGFEDTTDKINPRPSSIVWEESDTFATNVVWMGPLSKIRIQENTNTYRFSGRSPLAFSFLSLSWMAYDFAIGKPTDVPPESFEIWYRSSLDGRSFSDWFRTREHFRREDKYYGARFFNLCLPNGEIHRYFEILIHAPLYTSLGSANLLIADNTTNTLIKHGLMTDAAVKSAIEKGMISVETLEPAVKSELIQRGVITKDNSLIHSNRVEKEPSCTD